MTLDVVCGIVIGFAFAMLMARNAQTKMLIAAAKEWRDDLLSRLDKGEEYHAGVIPAALGKGSEGDDDFGDDDNDIPASDMPASDRFANLPDDYWKQN